MSYRYSYLPLYGVEPFANVAGAPVTYDAGTLEITSTGGGAKITGQNLLISLWAVAPADYDIYGVPTTGKLLQPASAVPESASVVGLSAGKAFAMAYSSRTSCRLGFQDRATESDTAIPLPLLGLLNPPGELKNYYQTAVDAVLDPSTPLGADITFKRTISLSALWELLCTTAIPVQTNIPGTIKAGDMYGGILPLARTSGADGVFPSFYPTLAGSTAAEIVAALDDIRRGNFFVPVLFQPVTGADWIAKITWPHSGARNS